MWTAKHITKQPQSTNLVKAEVMAPVISVNYLTLLKLGQKS